MARSKARAPYKMVGKTLWPLIRADYLGGMTAEAVARKYKIGVHNLRQTIHREGWSKKRLAEALTFTGEEPTPEAAVLLKALGEGSSKPDRPDTADQPLLDGALARARDALVRGRGHDAIVLMKGVKEYVVLANQVQEARDDTRRVRETWDRHQPARAGELDEPLLIHALATLWSDEGPEEQLQAAWMRLRPELREQVQADVEARKREQEAEAADGEPDAAEPMPERGDAVGIEAEITVEADAEPTGPRVRLLWAPSAFPESGPVL